MTAAAQGVVELSSVRFSWRAGAAPVVDIESLRLARGERLFLRGPSGSGKSTLLNLLAGVVTPQRGTVRILGRDLSALSGAARDRFRADHIGYIFQMFNLIPYLSVIENVCLPCGFSERRRVCAARAGVSVEAEALHLLKQLDMGGAEVLLARRNEVADKQRALAKAVNPALDGKVVRLPGYLLPLEFSGKQVTEFLLVPWVGACIHTPPPPPNQIVHVKSDKPFEMRGMFEAVWVSGRMATSATRKSVHIVDGSSEVDIGYSMRASQVERYKN